MAYITTTALKSIWHAKDLYRYKSISSVQFVSAHDHVINLQVNSWNHLLMIGDAALEQGPATIAVAINDFSFLKRFVKKDLTGLFSDNCLKIICGTNICNIKWKEGEPLSFSAQRFDNVNLTTAKCLMNSYKCILGKELMPTSAAALFNLPGGDIYFRQQIKFHFPKLVDALINKRKKEFLDNCRNIIGMGRGLTPSGDDLIHGALVAFNYFIYDDQFIKIIKKDFYSLASQTNLFGRHMLSLGLNGFTPLAVIMFLNTIAKGVADPDRFYRLLKLGSCTGHDIAVALLYFLGIYIDNTNKTKP